MNPIRYRSRWPALALLSLCLLISRGAPAGENVLYEYEGKTYEGYLAPSEGKGRLILLLHDWDGLTDYERRRADMLAELGYPVMAADLFGKGIRPTRDIDKRQHTGDLYKDRRLMRSLMEAALTEAGQAGFDRDSAVAIGYCFGGAAVLELARSGAPLAGFVTFHGGLATPEGQSYEETQAPVLVFHGSADRAISLSDLATLGAELEAAGVPHELTSYGGARHAFTVFDSDRYHAAADEQSWARFLAFLSGLSNADR